MTQFKPEDIPTLSPLPSTDQGPAPQNNDVNNEEQASNAAAPQSTAPTPKPAANKQKENDKDAGASDMVEWMQTLKKEIVDQGLTVTDVIKGVDKIADTIGDGVKKIADTIGKLTGDVVSGAGEAVSDTGNVVSDAPDVVSGPEQDSSTSQTPDVDDTPTNTL